MSCGRSVKLLFLLLISHNRQRSLISPCIHSPITPQFLPGRSQVESCFSSPLNFWYYWGEGDLDRSSYIWTYEAVLLRFFLASEGENFNTISKTASPDTVPSSANKPSRILTEYPSGRNFSHNWPNVLPTLQIPERLHRPHTTSQKQLSFGYTFRSWIVSYSLWKLFFWGGMWTRRSLWNL